MKRFFLATLIALFVGGLVFEKIAAGSGYVLIALGNTAYEMSFWTAALIIIGTVVLFHLVLWLIGSLFRFLFGATQKIATVGQKGQRKRAARGLIDFIEGNWKQARHHLLKSAKYAEMPMINYLAAARSTYELGNDSEAIELLHLAEQSNPDSALAVALTQARMYLSDNKFEQSMANLKRAREIAPQHPVVLELLQQNYLQLNDWSALVDMIPDLRRNKILPEETVNELEVKAYSQLIIQAGRSNSVEELDKQWDKTPKALRKNSAVFLHYVKQLIVVNDVARAENLLRKQINHNWDEQLVDFYGRILGNDPKRQMLFAKDWLKNRPGNAMLLLTLGRLALASEQWQEARDYFYASSQQNKNAQNCGELARLLYALGETEEAAQYFQYALADSEHALPDLPLPLAVDENATPNLRIVQE